MARLRFACRGAHHRGRDKQNSLIEQVVGIKDCILCQLRFRSVSTIGVRSSFIS